MWLSIAAIIISVLSLVLSFIAFRNSKSIKHAEVNSEVLTKIKVLEIEYSKLISEINELHQVVENHAPEKSIEITKELLKFKKYLENTRSHYDFLLRIENPISIETLEGIKHHIESLTKQTEFDKENYTNLKNKLNNEILSIKKSNMALKTNA